MLRKFGFLLFFAIALAGSSGLRAEENMIWGTSYEAYAHDFHPNNQILAIGEDNIGVILVNVLTGEPLDTLINTDGHGIINAIDFNSTGSKLAVATVDYDYSNPLSKLSVWDMETKQETVVEKNIQHYSTILHIQFTPNDSFLIYINDISPNNTDYDGVCKYNMFNSNKTKLNFPHHPITFSISRDNKYLAYTDTYIAEYNLSILYLYDLEADTICNKIYCDYTNPNFSLAKDELYLLKWKKKENNDWVNDCFKVLDPNNGFSELRSINLPAQFESYQLSSDGNFMAFSGYNIYLINTNDGKVAYNYNLEGNVAPISISKDMKYIAISTLIMLNARFGNVSVKETANQYFNFIQDADYTYLNITKLNIEQHIRSIKLSDISGNVVNSVIDETILNNEQITINTDSLSSGTYYMNITTNTGVYSHSFIIMR